MLLLASSGLAGQVRFDFDDGTLQGWAVVEGVFVAPVERHRGTASGKGGEGHYLTTDRSVPENRRGASQHAGGGVMESPVFVLVGAKATFELGGIGGPRNSFLALCEESGKELLRASKHNPKGLTSVSWNVSRFAGKRVFLRLVDRSVSKWCFASLDSFSAGGRIDPRATARRRKRVEARRRAAVAPALSVLSRTPDIVFAVREPGKNGHYYVSFGNWCHNPNLWMYGKGGRLCRLNAKTRDVTVLLDDPKGGVRDPQVHYDGKKILFSYRPGGTHYYHLFEIGVDGKGLRRLTDGPYDDIEPTYLPDGRIVFCSTRANRVVNCNLVRVALLLACEADGSGIRQLSPNVETETTPWPMPDGRVVYTRWEYVDRGIGGFKALWTMNPDGTGQMTLHGNMKPAGTFLDAKPIPETRSLVLIDGSHMGREHVGTLATFDYQAGPDAHDRQRVISWEADWRDPVPVGRDGFLAAREGQIAALSNHGAVEVLYELPEKDRAAGLWCHEPRPIVARKREPVVPPRVRSGSATGTLVLADVYRGRNMAGIRRGEIKELLVMASLPKPVNFSGRADPFGFDHSFTLVRVLGTAPVAADGSACVQVPAGRALFLAALASALRKPHSFGGPDPVRSAAPASHRQSTRFDPWSLERPQSRSQSKHPCRQPSESDKDLG